MTPEYLEQLADIADPDKLWTLPIFTQLSLPPAKRQQLDAGVALRRHAHHIRDLHALIGTGRSLLITSISTNSTAVKTVPTPKSHKRLLDSAAQRSNEC